VCRHTRNHVAKIGLSGQKMVTLLLFADMLLTCFQHFQPSAGVLEDGLKGWGETLKAPRVGVEDWEFGVCCPDVYCVDPNLGQGEEASADEWEVATWSAKSELCIFIFTPHRVDDV
jgi:hypothetical protein